jgi:hypothetical protein
MKPAEGFEGDGIFFPVTEEVVPYSLFGVVPEKVVVFEVDRPLLEVPLLGVLAGDFLPLLTGEEGAGSGTEDFVSEEGEEG